MEKTRALVVAALLALGCDSGGNFQPHDPLVRLGVWVTNPSVTILQSGTSGLASPTQSVVETMERWDTLWTEVWSDSASVPPVPQVDFVLSSVIVFGLGNRNGEGRAVHVDSVVVYTTGAIIHATEILPGQNCPVAGSFAPIHLVHAPGHPPVIGWEVRSVFQDCGLT